MIVMSEVNESSREKRDAYEWKTEPLMRLRQVIDRALADVDAGHRNNAIAGLISADVILREIEEKS